MTPVHLGPVTRVAARSSFRRRSSGSFPFSPSTPFGLLRWFVGDDIAGSNGDAISTWNDHRGLGFDALTGSSTARPTKQTSVINGHTVARFDGVNDVMAGTTALAVIRSLFVVVQYSAAAFSTYAGLVTAHQNNPAILVGDLLAPTTFFDFGGSFRLNRADSASRAAPMNAFGLVTVEYATGWDLLNLFVLGIGQDRAFGGRFWLGDVAELILYDRVLPVADRNAVEGYLANRYGL